MVSTRRARDASISLSGRTQSAYDAPSMTLYKSVSSNGYLGGVRSAGGFPASTAPARSRFETRPVSSHFLNANGMVTVRFVSILGAQKPSLTWTAVNGTGFTG